MAATSPARMVTVARLAPVSRFCTSHTMWSDSCRNHSTRSLPWMTGRMYSSVVGQYRLALHCDTTDGFHVTSERLR